MQDNAIADHTADTLNPFPNYYLDSIPGQFALQLRKFVFQKAWKKRKRLYASVLSLTD